MYIYLIKYFNHVIAAAEDDVSADNVIQQYMQNNKDMKIENFEKEAIRFIRNPIKLNIDLNTGEFSIKSEGVNETWN